MSERVGHSVHWGPVTTHHARDRVVRRPLLSVRSWAVATVALLVLAVLLAITLGSSGGAPLTIAAFVSAYVTWRATYQWREYNRAIAANTAKAQRAHEDEESRAMYRTWLRQQTGQDPE